MSNETIFPDNILALLNDSLGALANVNAVVRRNLNSADPHETVGIVVAEWMPTEYEMAGMGQEPTLADYLVGIQHVVKHSNEEIGLALHRESAREIKLMLYRDEGFLVRLRQLEEVSPGRRERICNYKVLGQRFASNQIDGAFVSMSATEVTFSTETSNS